MWVYVFVVIAGLSFMWVGVIQILLPSGVCRLCWVVVWICGLCAGGWTGCLGFLFGDLGVLWVSVGIALLGGFYGVCGFVVGVWWFRFVGFWPCVMGLMWCGFWYFLVGVLFGCGVCYVRACGACLGIWV